MSHPPRPTGLVPPALVLAVVTLAGFGPALSWDVPPGATLYRLESGSTWQRGCLDPDCWQIPEPVPLSGTFVMTGTYRSLQLDGFEITNVIWRATSGDDLRLWGGGRGNVREGSMLGMGLTLKGDVIPDVTLFGQEARLGGPQLDLTLTANVAPYDDIALVLKASPVPRDQVHWYRLIGGSEYNGRPLGGTFGLIDPLAGSSEAEVVLIRWSAAPAAGATDPSRLFLMGAGSAGPRVVLIMSEDDRIQYGMEGEIRDAGASVLEFSLRGPYGEDVRVRAKRD